MTTLQYNPKDLDDDTGTQSTLNYFMLPLINANLNMELIWDLSQYSKAANSL